MYGLMCVALLVLRRADPDWYTPDFACPLYPVLPVLGAVASFGLVAFMEPLSIALGAGVLIAAAGWYRIYAHDVSLKEVLS
jgi:hypothetical protein